MSIHHDTQPKPGQLARDRIDQMLRDAGWAVQDVKKINLNEKLGVAVREFPTDSGPADYILFVDGKPLGVIEAKKEEEGHRFTTVEEQSEKYAQSQLKWVANDKPLRFIYESTGALTTFTDANDPSPGMKYYRLKQMDLDGVFEYSKTVSVKVKGDGIGISLFPNPARSSFILSLEAEYTRDATLTLYDLLGQHKKTSTLTLEGRPLRSHIELGGLPSGVYVAEVTAGRERWWERLVK